MPRLVVGNTELGCGMLKKGKGFLKPNLGVGPKPGGAFIEPSRSSRADIIAALGVREGVLPGGETTITLDEPDVLDGGDVVEGLGGDGLSSGPSSVTGRAKFLIPSVN